MKRWKKVVLGIVAGPALLILGVVAGGAGGAALIHALSGVLPEAQALAPLSLVTAGLGGLGLPYLIFRD